ncbi:apolipoprotein N-acyltransferase [Streptomyces paludis]|uniref:Apolipoprotein N-acyltransferase n=1 Tax=Streptomyces paludis TaxID=2282738 RepID=A0A345HJ58_9ACTN|nr:apolipoprotein N-acyltransferase [Streptomyces paludis]AXG76732.1 apolipoprotein N-acyltransferase [Streptomyces paludis]
MRIRWWRGAAAAGAGALPALAFPAPSLWWSAYAALVPWMLLVRSAPTARRAALEGWLGGLGFMAAVHHWLLPSLHVFLVVLAALLGLLWAPWGVLVRYALGGTPSVRRAGAAVAVVPSGWLMVELARSWEGLGGPWGLLGAGQWEVSPALRLASVGGVWLVSLLVVAVNTALVVAIAVAGARRVGAGALVLCAVVVGSVEVWLPRPSGLPEPSSTGSGTAGSGSASASAPVRIAVVQPGVVAPGVVDGADSVERRFARGEALTRTLAGQDLALVVWGESSVGADLATRPDLAARLAVLSRRVGAPLLVNVDARSTDAAGRTGVFKRAALVGPAGPTGDTYDKMRLVPFGEYVPARSALGWVTSVGRAAGEDRVRGTGQVVMVLPGEGRGGPRVGPLICFETAFPDMSRRLVREGAQVLVGQSSTSSFQGSWAPEQHASLAALRAAETGRPMVHATLTGVSAVFGPDGERVGGAIGTDRSAAAVFDVPPGGGTTAYVRFGDWAVYGALAVLAVLGAVEGRRALRACRVTFDRIADAVWRVRFQGAGKSS